MRWTENWATNNGDINMQIWMRKAGLRTLHALDLENFIEVDCQWKNLSASEALLCTDRALKEETLVLILMSRIKQGLDELPTDVLAIVISHLNQNQLPAFASTCRLFRETQKNSKPARQLKTNLKDVQGQYVSREWLKWCVAFSSLKDGTVTKNKILAHIAFCTAYNGYLDVLEWIKKRHCDGNGNGMKLISPWNQWTCYHAAKGGQRKVLQWLRNEGCPWNGWTCEGARSGGHPRVLKWLRSQGCETFHDIYIELK